MHHLDEAGNVIIYKNGTKGYENSAPVILQGHLDMVCEKAADYVGDMEKDGIFPVTDGKYIWAEKTTLGADDGIAIAYILSVLDSEKISHPPIEALFTVGEETGMTGAAALDSSLLKGKRLINLDSEKEGILTVSCAGGIRAECEMPLSMIPSHGDSVFIEISVSGLMGGHSGVDINKHRRNAVTLLGRLLYELNRTFGIKIASLSGGTKENIIPKNAEAVVFCMKKDSETILSKISEFFDKIKKENRENDRSLVIFAKETDGTALLADDLSTEKIIFALMHAPDGIMEMSADIKGMVQTSMNLGTAVICKEKLLLKYLVRSNSDSEKSDYSQKLRSFYEYLHGNVRFYSDYPAWEYRKDSPLRETAAETYKELFGENIGISALHAGLECGILSSKIQGADIISFGPDIENAHTASERLDVFSAARCYDHLLRLLEKLK